MAIARVCDACGKYYNEAEQENQLTAVFELIPKRVSKPLESPPDHWHKYHPVDETLPKRLDLCNECYTKILNIVHPDSRENPPC